MSILLSNMYADVAQRIDGSGGDGGRDVQLVYPDGTDGYELKSFTGRLKGGKREQVKRSLRKAAFLNLRSWSLVVPVNPTPKELEWFEGLRSLIACPIRWLDKSWLEAQLAERPFIARYYINRAEDEVVALLRELREEEAALAHGMPDAASRARRLAARANELDPHYRFKIESDGEATTIIVVPRYPGAERDRPIEVKTRFTFPADSDEARAAYAELEEHIKFGTPVKIAGEFIERVTVDAPAGLGGEWTGGTIEMTSRPPDSDDRRLSLAVTDSNGGYLAQVTLSMKVAHRGRSGVVLKGSDRSGSLKARIKLDAEQRSMQITVTFMGAQHFIPADMLPLARFVEQLSDNPSLAVVGSDGREIGTVAGGLDDAKEWVTEGFADLVEDIAIIQAKSGRIEPLKPDFTVGDVNNIRSGARWARGEPVVGSWENISIALLEDVDEDTRRRLASEASSLRLVSPGPATVSVQGFEYRFGSTSVANFESAQLSDLCRRRYRNRVPPPGAVVTLVPGDSDRVETIHR